MKRAAAAGSAFLALVAAALAVGACGSDAGSDDRFDLMLDYVVNPDHAGIYTATDKGYFDDEGLDVEIRLPPDPAAPIKQVAAGRVDLAISYQPEVVLAREQGLDVVAVAALVNGPLTSLISLPAAGIDDPADLEGTTVVDAGIPYQSAYLRTILDNAGVDPDTVEEVNVGFNLVPPLLSGKADAMLGGFLNVEGVQLEADGENPRVVPVDELGVPPYDELVLVADAERVRDDPGQIEDFLAALERGNRRRRRPGRGDGRDRRRRRRRPRPHPQADRRHASAPRGADPGNPTAIWTRPSGSVRRVPGRADRRGPKAFDELLTNDLLPGS